MIRGGEKATLRGNRLPGLHNRTTRVRINRRESSLWLGQSRYGKITILRLIFMPEVRGRRVIYRAFHLKTSKKMTQTTESSRISLKKNYLQQCSPHFSVLFYVLTKLINVASGSFAETFFPSFTSIEVSH